MSSHKSIKNKVDLKEIFTNPKNIDFYNLFAPLMPGAEKTGNYAQILSALTVAYGVGSFCYYKMEGWHIAWVLLLMVFAVTPLALLIGAFIEISGRKALQVFTRTLIWRKFNDGWYWVLFVFSGFLTGILFWFSYAIPANTIRQNYEGDIKPTVVLNDSSLVKKHSEFEDKVNAKFDKLETTLENAYTLEYNGLVNTYKAKEKTIKDKIKEFENAQTRGVKWAKSHVLVQKEKLNALLTEKETALSAIDTRHAGELKELAKERKDELKGEKDRHTNEVTVNQTSLTENNNHENKNKSLLALLFSSLIGLSNIVEVICIVMVEVFRRGAKIEINSIEDEVPPSMLEVLVISIQNRFYNWGYRQILKIYAPIRTDEFMAKIEELDPDRTPTPRGGKHSNYKVEVNNGNGKQSDYHTSNSDAAHKNEVNTPVNNQGKVIPFSKNSTSKPASQGTNEGQVNNETVNNNGKQTGENSVSNTFFGKHFGKQSDLVNNNGKQSNGKQSDLVNNNGKQSNGKQSDLVNNNGKQSNGKQSDLVNNNGKQETIQNGKQNEGKQFDYELVNDWYENKYGGNLEGKKPKFKYVGVDLFIEWEQEVILKTALLNRLKSHKNNYNKIMQGKEIDQSLESTEKNLKKYAFLVEEMRDFESGIEMFKKPDAA